MLPLFLHSGPPKSSILPEVKIYLRYFPLLNKKLVVKLLFKELGMMIIICLRWGAVVLVLAESVDVVDNGCGGGGDYASQRVEAVDICPQMMMSMCSQELLHFPVKFQELTFVPLDDSK
eukprot:6833889-Ditylum_brightwellii.AAC.1